VEGLILYLLPTIIAWFRKKKNHGTIFFWNFFFGWTVIGWIIPLIMACSNEAPQKVVIVDHKGRPSS
jgi:hypothetical protein